nr:uncharacterized protein LOC113399522 [Vanessa tameamea]
MKINRWVKKIQNERFRKLYSIKEDTNEDVMLKVFENIFDTIMIMEKTSKLVIFNHFFMEFLQSLAYIKIWIEWLRNETIDDIIFTTHTVGVILWTVKGIVVEITLCVCCEILHNNVKSARVAAILLLNNSKFYNTKRFAKKVLKITAIRYKKLNGLGVFDVDAMLLLHFAALLANYTVVLLQFAFT